MEQKTCFHSPLVICERSVAGELIYTLTFEVVGLWPSLELWVVALPSSGSDMLDLLHVRYMDGRGRNDLALHF